MTSWRLRQRSLQIYDARERWLVGAADVAAVAARMAPPRRTPSVRAARPAAPPRAHRRSADGARRDSGRARRLAGCRDRSRSRQWNAPLAQLIPGVDHVQVASAPWLAREAQARFLARARRHGAQLAQRAGTISSLNFEPDIRSNAAGVAHRRAAPRRLLERRRRRIPDRRGPTIPMSTCRRMPVVSSRARRARRPRGGRLGTSATRHLARAEAHFRGQRRRGRRASAARAAAHRRARQRRARVQAMAPRSVRAPSPECSQTASGDDRAHRRSTRPSAGRRGPRSSPGCRSIDACGRSNLSISRRCSLGWTCSSRRHGPDASRRRDGHADRGAVRPVESACATARSDRAAGAARRSALQPVRPGAAAA